MASDNEREKERVRQEKERIRQEKLDTIQNAKDAHKKLCDKVDEAVKPLQEALKMAIDLEKKLSYGIHRDMGSNRRMYVRNLLQNIDAANKQLVRSVKMSRVMSSSHLNGLEEDVNSGTAYR